MTFEVLNELDKDKVIELINKSFIIYRPNFIFIACRCN